MKNQFKMKMRLINVMLAGICMLIISGPYTVLAKQTETVTNEKENNEMIPFYWMIIVVGGCIAITLVYVSWKKYRGEEKRRVKKGPNR